VWNNGNMPKNLDSAEKLFDKHSSEPLNPNLAQVFFKSGGLGTRLRQNKGGMRGIWRRIAGI
jgi:hypothetical protein